jgi:AbiV family abortive infection protein
MKKPELETVKVLLRKCLDNSEALLSSAKVIRGPGRNHIAYHLAALALEEVGKASMLLVETVRPLIVQDDDHGDDDQGLSNSFADHKKKLFWAMLTPSLDAGTITPVDFNTLREIANDIHFLRLASLYVNLDNINPQVEVADERLEILIGLTEARLNLEKLKRIRELDADEQQVLDWFVKAFADSQMQLFFLSEQSRNKLLEFSGDSRKWMMWLHEQVSLIESKNKELMEKELKRLEPTGVLANKPKWRFKIKLFSPSHSTRHKQLNPWNEQVQWIKLFPTKDKTELVAEFTLPAKVPATDLWQSGLQMCSMFVVALNIATVGYYWWYLPEFVSKFYEDLYDLENNAFLQVERNPPLVLNVRRTALKIPQLNAVGLVFAQLIRATQEQASAYGRYMRGLALLAKNDIFVELSGGALIEFAHAFRIALAAYGDWDGVVENFDKAASLAVEGVWINPEMTAEFKALIEAAEALENKLPPSRPITIEEAFKLKAFCDGYLVKRAQREVQKAMQQGQSAEPSKTDETVSQEADPD